MDCCEGTFWFYIAHSGSKYKLNSIEFHSSYEIIVDWATVIQKYFNRDSIFDEKLTASS